MSHRKFLSLLLSTTATLAAASAAYAGEPELTGTDGDGVIIIATTEGVTAPGVQTITTDPDNDDYTSTNGFGPQTPPNCIMASNGLGCDAAPRSGNRAKFMLTGRNPFDLFFDVTPSGGITEYFVRSRVQNGTGARMIGFQILIGQGSGDSFQTMGVLGETGVQFDNLTTNSTAQTLAWLGSTSTTSQDPLQRAFYSAGMFGSNIQTVANGDIHESVGFFSDEERAALFFNPADTSAAIQDTLIAGTGVNFDPDTGNVLSTVYADNFGASTAMVDSTVLPQGILWDNDGDPTTDAVLMAAFLDGEWVTYRELDANGNFVTRLDPDGTPIPVNDNVRKTLTDEQVAALLASGVYEQDVVEDVSKVNVNFSIDVGNLDGTFTLRLVPIFAPIVTNAETDYQWEIARRIDYGRVPYLGYDGIFAVAADAVESLPEDQQPNGIERLGFGYVGAFNELAFAMGRMQMNNTLFRLDGTRAGTGVFSSNADRAQESADGHAMPGTDNTYGYTDNFAVFLTASGATGSIDTDGVSVGNDYDAYSLTGGFDFRFSDRILVGAAAGFTQADAKMYDQRGSLGAESTSFMVYTGIRPGGGLFIDAGIGAADIEYESKRTVIIGTTFGDLLQGLTDGEATFMRLNAGWDFQMNDRLTLSPMIEVQNVEAQFDAFTEAGSGLAMQVDSVEADSLLYGPGIRGILDSSREWGALRIRGKAAYLFDANADDDTAVMTQFTGGGSAFETPILGVDHSGLNINAGIAAVFGEADDSRWAAGLDYDGQFGDEFEEHRLTLSLKARF